MDRWFDSSVIGYVIDPTRDCPISEMVSSAPPTVDIAASETTTGFVVYILFLFSFLVLIITVGVRPLLENEFLFIGYAPACSGHKLDMVKRLSQNKTDGTCGRVVFVCPIPQVHGGCDTRLYPVDPVTHAPMLSETAKSSHDRSAGLFFSICS